MDVCLCVYICVCVCVCLCVCPYTPISHGLLDFKREGSCLLSQRESLVTVKFFDFEISMIFDISELPESKYEAFHVNCPSARHASLKSCYF